MRRALEPRGITQGVGHAALAGPEELARAAGFATVLRLGSNESPFGPSPKALAALHASAAEAHRYGDPSMAELREAVAAHHRVAPDNVAVGAGIDDLLGSIVRAYLPPGGRAVAARGAFPTFEMHATGYGADLHLVPYRPDGRLDLSGFVAAARGGALVFMPNPDNPSGSVCEWRDVMTLLDELPDGSLLLHDEAYANFLPAARRFPAGFIDERMLRLRTFSKEHGLAGMRVGYALGTPAAVAALDAVRLLYGVSRPAQAAAKAALADGAFVEDVVERIAEGRSAYEALGRRLGLPVLPSATNFVLFDCAGAERARAIVAGLLANGIHIRKPPYAPLDRYVRISVGAPLERARLAGVLERLLATGIA